MSLNKMCDSSDFIMVLIHFPGNLTSERCCSMTHTHTLARRQQIQQFKLAVYLTLIIHSCHSVGMRLSW